MLAGIGDSDGNPDCLIAFIFVVLELEVTIGKSRTTEAMDKGKQWLHFVAFQILQPFVVIGRIAADMARIGGGPLN